jgi:hypothetical protein
VPSQIQALLEDAITTPVRGEPHIALEQIDRDEVVVRVAATPVVDSDGPRLADEVLSAMAAVTRDGGGGSRPADTGRDPGQVSAERDGRRHAGELTGQRDGLRHEGELTGQRDGRRRDAITQEYES